MIYTILDENNEYICDVPTLREAKATIKEFKHEDSLALMFRTKYKIVENNKFTISKFRVDSEKVKNRKRRNENE
jgi:hypothetical protein